MILAAAAANWVFYEDPFMTRFAVSVLCGLLAAFAYDHWECWQHSRTSMPLPAFGQANHQNATPDPAQAEATVNGKNESQANT